MQLRLPGMHDARSPIKKISRLRARLIGWLLHNANSSPPMFSRKEFYDMKERILTHYGTPGEVEYQHFNEQECFHCRSFRYCEECEDYGKCCRCDSSRIYRPEVWIRLLPWELGGFRFHTIRGKQYELPFLGVVKYEGKVIHGLKPYLLPEECRMWLELFFDTKRFFRYLGYSGHYGKESFKRPLVSLGTVVHIIRFDRWHLLHKVLPFRLYWWLRCRMQDDSIPF